MYRECSPRLIGCHVVPPSSVPKAAAAVMAIKILLGIIGSRRIVVQHIRPAPTSVVPKPPPAELAIKILLVLIGSRRMVCRHIPPAPGDHWGPEPCPRRPGSSCHVSPLSVERNKAASSTPAST